MDKKKTIQILLLILLLGASARIGRCFLANWIERDPVAYITMSKYIAQGEIEKAVSIRPELPPLHITMIAGLSKIGLSAERAGVLISLISGILIILAIFLIAAMVFNDKIALLAAFIASLQTELVSNSTFILRDSLSLCLALFALYYAMWAIKKHLWWKWCLVGVLTGVCSLTRPDGLGIFLAILLWIFISFVFYPVERRQILTKCLPGLVISMIFFCAVALPVQTYFQHYGSIYTVFVNRKILSIFLGLNI